MDGISIIFVHDFYCTCCGRKGIPVGKDRGVISEKGNLRKIICQYCNREVNHAEVVENSQYDRIAFFDEFNSGNFDRNGDRLIPLKEWNLLYYGSFDKKVG